MTETAQREVLRKVRKLAQLPEEVRQSRWAVSITRLTVLKSLCQGRDAAHRFAAYLAHKTLERIAHEERRPTLLRPETVRAHEQLMVETVAAMGEYVRAPTEADRQRLWELLRQLEAEHNDYRRIYGGPVRTIEDSDLLHVEYALHTPLADVASVPVWAYKTARHYAERYDPSHGTGLIPESAPLVQDIADFWSEEFGLDSARLTTPTKEKQTRKGKPTARK